MRSTAEPYSPCSSLRQTLSLWSYQIRLGYKPSHIMSSLRDIIRQWDWFMLDMNVARLETTLPHVTNNQYFIMPLWCNGKSLLGPSHEWVQLLYCTLIDDGTSFCHPWSLTSSTKYKSRKKLQAGMTRSASWVAYFYEYLLVITCAH